MVKNRLVRLTAAALSGGVLAGTSCSSDAIHALVIGLEAAASELDGERDDISFSDWLESELDDL